MRHLGVFTECGQYTDSSEYSKFFHGIIPIQCLLKITAAFGCTLYFNSVTIHVRAIKFRKCGITVPDLLLIRKYMLRISYTY